MKSKYFLKMDKKDAVGLTDAAYEGSPVGCEVRQLLHYLLIVIIVIQWLCCCSCGSGCCGCGCSPSMHRRTPFAVVEDVVSDIPDDVAQKDDSEVV